MINANNFNKKPNEDHEKAICLIFTVALSIFILIGFLSMAIFLPGCTLNLQTIHTSGKSQYLIEDDLKTDADFKIPVS